MVSLGWGFCSLLLFDLHDSRCICWSGSLLPQFTIPMGATNVLSTDIYKVVTVTEEKEDGMEVDA